MTKLTPRLGQPDFPLAGLQFLYGGDNVVTKLEVGDKAYIVESNRIVREVFILKRSRDFYTVRFVENASGGIQLRASRLFVSGEDAESSIPKKLVQKRTGFRSPYDYL